MCFALPVRQSVRRERELQMAIIASHVVSSRNYAQSK